METATLNGSVNGTPARKARRFNPPAPARGTRKHARRLPACRKVAIGVGAVGVTLLVLSVWHCTEALVVLTGAPAALAGLMAVGIDAGLVVSELAAIIGEADDRTRRWANAYIFLAIVLSAGLNSLANGLHAADYLWPARIVGLIIPALVLILSKLTGLLWRSK
jgi:hypothetical protein